MNLILHTSNQEELYCSLENLFNVRKEFIHLYILKHMSELKDQTAPFKDINLSYFLMFLSLKANRVVDFPDFDGITISHLTTRTSAQNIIEEPLYNLFETLTKKTELKLRLESIGLTFFEEDGKLKTVFHEKTVDWRTYLSGDEYPTAQMIINRLEGNRFGPPDKCVNGFLFGGNIYENGNVRHIQYLPEIVENILRILGKHQLIRDLCRELSPYIIKFAVPIDDIIFDGYKKLTLKQTQFRIIRHCLHYLSNQHYRSWGQYDNPIIRVVDERSVPADQIVSVEKVDPQ
ncbi:hypothetical protein [Brevibacillus brevis]|uniref:hypothetical protein n=1 Tax=Brevibacillus brevis TaxID=1393 RepID=UPI0037C85D23